MRLKIVIERGLDGYHLAHCPALKGCRTQGRTQAEALANMREAIRLYLDSGKSLQPNAGQKVLNLTL